MEEVVRKYHVSDVVLQEFAGEEIVYLEDDLQDFTDYDPDLNAELLALLDSTYKSTQSFGTDETQLGIVSQLTEEVSVEFENCKSIAKDVRYFAKKKFGHSPAILKQFGFNSYTRIRKNQPKMVSYMFELAKVAENYKTDLLAAGLKQTTLDKIKPAATALEGSNIDQETGKGGRSLSAEDRIKLFNSLYDILHKFSDAAKIIFAANALKRQRYMIPYNSGGGEESTT